MYKLYPFKNAEEAIDFAVEQFIAIAKEAIQKRDCFTVALSGGSTPRAIYERLARDENRDCIAWKKVFIFFSDERAVGEDDPKSNYKMAIDAGFHKIPYEKDHLFRMKGEGDLKAEAKAYEALIQAYVPDEVFDLVMLGMGDDGHTASLFPFTEALHEEKSLVVANVVPQKKEERLTFTYPCIERARHVFVYVIGQEKHEMLDEILNHPLNFERLPLQKVIHGENDVSIVYC